MGVLLLNLLNRLLSRVKKCFVILNKILSLVRSNTLSRRKPAIKILYIWLLLLILLLSIILLCKQCLINLFLLSFIRRIWLSLSSSHLLLKLLLQKLLLSIIIALPYSPKLLLDKLLFMSLKIFLVLRGLIVIKKLRLVLLIKLLLLQLWHLLNVAIAV